MQISSLLPDTLIFSMQADFFPDFRFAILTLPPFAISYPIRVDTILFCFWYKLDLPLIDQVLEGQNLWALGRGEGSYLRCMSPPALPDLWNATLVCGTSWYQLEQSLAAVVFIRNVIMIKSPSFSKEAQMGFWLLLHFTDWQLRNWKLRETRSAAKLGLC